MWPSLRGLRPSKLMNKAVLLFLTCFFTLLALLKMAQPFLNPPPPEPVNPLANFSIVTAFTEDHFPEALASCESAGRLPDMRKQRHGVMIAYLLGPMSNANLTEYKSKCPFVEVRYFDWHSYPVFMRMNLRWCAWKAVVVRQVLESVETVLWVDSSIVFNETAHDTLTDRVERMDRDFSTCGFQFLGNGLLNIFATTHPATLRQFSITYAQAKKTELWQARFYLVKRSPKSVAIMDQLVACSMDEKCVAPQGAQHRCDLPRILEGEYGGCHRYDQSIISILMLKCSEDPSKYSRSSDLLFANRILT